MKLRFWQIFNEIVDYQDLYRTKEEILKKNLKRKPCFLTQKILYFTSISVKCIKCRVKGLKKSVSYLQRRTDLQTGRLTYGQSDS